MLNKYCIDCGKKVSRLGTKRCRKCYSPYLSKMLSGKKKSREHIEKISGKNHYAWKGGRVIGNGGYILIKDRNHPFSQNGYVLEHRVIIEKSLGRFLKRDEKVHHINHNKQDNRLENLMLFSNHSQHLKFEHKEGRYYKHTHSGR